MEIFATRLRQIRSERGSLFEIASEFGISDRTLGSWERGRTEPPLATVALLALRFGVSSDWLLGLSDDRAVSCPASGQDLDAWRERAFKAEGKVELLQQENAALRRALGSGHE